VLVEAFVAQNLAVTLGAALAESFTSLSTPDNKARL